MKRFLVIFSCVLSCMGALAQTPQYVTLQVYYSSTQAQVAQQSAYLENALLPALHSQGVKNIGVFEALANDTAATKKIYVLYAVNSFKDWERIMERINSNKTYLNNAAPFLNAAHDKAAYNRVEQIWMRAFAKMPQLAAPKLKGAKADHVYELRSYESPTESLYRNKVAMFNAGGETVIFNRLNFNAVFYGDVIFGSRMPNLMYLTSFENMADRDAHWKAFGDDPAWKTLRSLPQYQNNVSHIDITFLRALPYSDY